jgi:uncharacterized surface protein with fasciclin (FAS1) repeats
MMVLFTFFILHSSFFIFSSCSDEPAAENYYVFNGEMVSDYLVNREETFSDFIAILNRSGMYGMMATYGTYTCLAPTNDAVELYLKEHGKSSVDELTKAECDTIAWNHIIKYAYFTTDLSDGNIPSANLNDRYLTFSTDSDSVSGVAAYYINKNSKLIARDDSVENGVVHTLDHVIQPNSQYLPELLREDSTINLFNAALKGNPDCGGIMSYNYVSGEPVTGFADGRPLFVRSANDKFNLANFMRAIISGAIGVLKVGNDILFNEEKIKVDRITGHGGLFTTPGVGQRILGAALNSPISCMKTAGEGGPWGMAILASYLINNKKNQSLAEFLDEQVFAGDTGTSVAPTPEDVAGFNAYIENYKQCLPIEAAAVEYKK